MLGFFINNAYSANEMTAAASKTEATLQLAIIDAIGEAVIDDSEYNCTVDVSDYTTEQVNTVMRMLTAAHFTCTNSGDNLVITW